MLLQIRPKAVLDRAVYGSFFVYFVKETRRKAYFTFIMKIIRGDDHLKNNLVDFRKKYGLSQERLAEKLGVSRQTIISIEKGKYDPSLPLAFELARAFNTTLEELFIYEGKEE